MDKNLVSMTPKRLNFSHVNQEREISISLFFAVKSRFDAPVFMPREGHGNVINDSKKRRR